MLGQAAALAVIGLVAGAAIVQFARDPLSRVLFEVSPADAGSTGAAAAILIGACLLACLPAAVRAMRVNPIEGLRQE